MAVEADHRPAAGSLSHHRRASCLMCMKVKSPQVLLSSGCFSEQNRGAEAAVLTLTPGAGGGRHSSRARKWEAEIFSGNPTDPKNINFDFDHFYGHYMLLPRPCNCSSPSASPSRTRRAEAASTATRDTPSAPRLGHTSRQAAPHPQQQNSRTLHRRWQ